MVNIAIIGIGAWGMNHVRNFAELQDANLYACCDLNLQRLNQISKAYPGTQTTQDYEQILNDSAVDAVVIAASAATHFHLAKQALQAGKHVFIEKPMTLDVAEAEELIRLSEQAGLVLMVGHLMEYHPGTEKLKQLICDGELGKIYYFYSQRVNLGKIRADENALWSFAPHDISMMLYLLNQFPINVSARGESYLQKGIHDVVFVTLRFPNQVMANIHLSWLDPHKIRKITVVGSKKMAVFDDVDSAEKIKIYDHGVEPNHKVVSYSESFTLRYGDIIIPHIRMTEPLKIECQHFLDCIQRGQRPRSDGQDGLRVVKVLQAAQRSLDKDGVPVVVEA